MLAALSSLRQVGGAELALVGPAASGAHGAAAGRERKRLLELHACAQRVRQACREGITAAVGVDCRSRPRRSRVAADAPVARAKAPSALAVGPHHPLRLLAHLLCDTQLTFGLAAHP